jgi:succinyl-CoA synthetase beta subunit
MALDAKVSIDDNALFRHREFEGFETDDDGREAQARREGMRYVALDGDIGVLGNGAGMVMSTLDLIAEAGGRAANFLDVGGGAREAQIAAALDLILSDERVRAVLVTIFGGITRCDEVARGLLAALESRGLAAKGDEGAALPVVVRLDGTSCDPARALVADARLANVVAEATAWEAVQRVVALAAAAPAAPRTTPPATPAAPTNPASPGDTRGRA